ncbi:MAG: chemotaxis protein CheA, partial [bacterium]|nr:chemotaxis protein CheA [bacterium]
MKKIKHSKYIFAQWNENLEEIVRQKTAAIKNILDNSGQGFLTFSDNLLIDEEYSIECEKIFGTSITGMKFSNLIYSEGEERDYFELMLVKILNEKKEYKKEIYLSLLPEEKIINNKYIKISYKIIDRNLTNDEAIIMVILTDITGKRSLENKNVAENKVLKMVVRAVT